MLAYMKYLDHILKLKFSFLACFEQETVLYTLDFIKHGYIELRMSVRCWLYELSRYLRILFEYSTLNRQMMERARPPSSKYFFALRDNISLIYSTYVPLAEKQSYCYFGVTSFWTINFGRPDEENYKTIIVSENTQRHVQKVIRNIQNIMKNQYRGILGDPEVTANI